MAESQYKDGDLHLGTNSPNKANDPDVLNQMSLKLVDDLRRVDRNLELPQIVVCGNQSCGKSSVLEAISGLDFPRGDGIVTTFATQLALRRGEQRCGSVRVDEIRFEANLDSLSELGNSIRAAKAALLEHHQESKNGISENTIFEETVQIEVTHPSWPPLTLVDLPGLIENPNSTQTERDVDLIQKLVRQNMKRKKTIILAIIDGNSEPAVQKILKLAKKFDHKGERTIGVITKPDEIKPGTPTEREFLRCATNARPDYHFKHWHVLRNRAFNENYTLAERDKMEAEFFRDSIWEKELERGQLGIDALRSTLSNILEQHVHHELPGLVKSLNVDLEKCTKDLSHLRQARDTFEDQQKYLLEISTAFEILVKQNTSGISFGESLGESFAPMEGRSLRALVQEYNENFARYIYEKGHFYEEVDANEGPTGRIKAHRGDTRPFPPCSPKRINRKEFVDVVQAIRRQNYCSTFPGALEPSHVNKLFQKQASPWRQIAEAHVDSVWSLAVQAINNVINHIASEPTAGKLREYLMKGELEDVAPEHFRAEAPNMLYSLDRFRKDLRTKLSELLRPYEEFRAATLDPEYFQTLARRRYPMPENERDGITACLAVGKNESAADYIQEKLSTYEMVVNGFASNDSEMLDLMHVYYKGALRTFVDNVAVLAIESCLMYPLHQLFTPMRVADIAQNHPDLLAELASEPEQARRLRLELTEKRRRLEKACNLASAFSARLPPVLFSGYSQPNSGDDGGDVRDADRSRTGSTPTSISDQSDSASTPLAASHLSSHLRSTSDKFLGGANSKPDLTPTLSSPAASTRESLQTPNFGGNTNRRRSSRSPLASSRDLAPTVAVFEGTEEEL